MDIVFPAGILQPPIFDAAADDAINYGAAGADHRTRADARFDDQGRTVDARAACATGGRPPTPPMFKARTAELRAQYGRYEPLPGIHVNRHLTMGENIADLGGLTLALDAYHASLDGKRAPVMRA